jgi:Domain of unknown function (DUF397)
MRTAASSYEDPPIRAWRRSSRSYGNGNCLEVAEPVSQYVQVRDSKNPQGAVLQFTPVGWTAFLGHVRSGSISRD